MKQWAALLNAAHHIGAHHMTYLASNYDDYRDMEDERLGLNEPAYYVGGQPCWSYEEACAVAGIETPAELALEDKFWDEERRITDQDAIEARGGPNYYFPAPLECPF
jgi:hypothetical protein